MKLLIVTQKIDKNDPILGFFHRWVEEFSKHCERIIVICLEKGKYNLPKNVSVHSLGKEENVSKLKKLSTFYFLLFTLRKEYDAVFVHMNPEYVVLGGFLWRIWGKRIGLWYVHKSVTLKLRFASVLAYVIFTASPESFRLKSGKVKIIGHGIDTRFFTPDASVVRENHALSVGRLSKSKRHDIVIVAAALARRELRIIGEGAERKNLELLAHRHNIRVHFLGGITQERLRDEYRKAACLVHTSETGSLDKVVLEALATNLPVITTGSVYEDFPVQIVLKTPEAIAETLNTGRENYNRVSIIKRDHSLERLIPTIIKTLT